MVRAARYVRDGGRTVVYRYDGDGQIFYKADGDADFRSTSFESVGDFHAPGCTLLDNGNVLFVGGGKYPIGSNQVMEHDVARNVFVARAELDVWVRDVRGIKLPDGRVFTVGGWFASSCDDKCTYRTNMQVRIYDPRTDTWTPGSKMTQPMNKLYLLPGGRVLMCGSCLWYYDVDSGSAIPLLRTRNFTKVLSIDAHGIITYCVDRDYAESEGHPGIDSEWGAAVWTDKLHAQFGYQVSRATTAIILALHRAGVQRGHIRLVLETLTADRLDQVGLTRVRLRSRRAPGILATARTQLVAGT